MSAGKNGVIALALAIVAVLVFAAPASAAGPLPTGHSQGVKIVWKGSQVIVFGKRAAGLYKKIAGRKVIVSCWRLTDGGRNGGPNPVWAPKRGRVLKTGDGVRDWDYCQVWRPAWTVRRRNTTTYHQRMLVVSIPLTQKGAVYVDEQVKAVGLSALLLFARRGNLSSPTGPFHASSVVVDFMGGVLRLPWFWPGRHPLVALATPDQTPALGAVGYFSDGLEHAAAVTLSASGRRLFIEHQRDDALHTNVAQYTFGGFR